MVCRLCLTETEFCLPIKKAENQEKEEEETEDIAEIIRKHFDFVLDINSDFVCTVCWQQISEFHTFYLFIEEKQKELNQQSLIAEFIGTSKDATPITTDYEHGSVMENEVAAKHGEGMDIKYECLMVLNAPLVTEKIVSQWAEGATLQEATENLNDVKDEFIDDVSIKTSNREPSATSTETVSIYEMAMKDEDDDMDMKIESLIEISSRMITENSLCQWNQEASPQKVTENLDTKNNELIDQVDLEPARCETNANDTSETARTQQNKITPTETEKQDLDKEIKSKKRDFTIAKHAGILKCELCAQTVDSFGSLKQHFKKEHGRKGYVKCCNKRYYLSSNYQEHLEWHSNPNLWKYEHCEAAMVKSLELCEPCNLVHSCRDSYDSHMFQVHPEVERSNIQCSLCSAKFSERYLLRQHIKSQHSDKTFKCDECNREFTTLLGLKHHVRKNHLNIYRTECDICGKSFISRENCKIHKAQIHQVAESFNYQCTHCPQKFGYKRLLRKHNNNFHNAQKCKCNECNKEFKSWENLKNHKRRTHLRAYDVECDLCGKTFSNGTHLIVHKSRVHGLEESLDFQCPLCPKKFPLKSLLNAHGDETHNKQNLKCDKCGKEFSTTKNVKRHKRNIVCKIPKANLLQGVESLNL